MSIPSLFNSNGTSPAKEETTNSPAKPAVDAKEIANVEPSEVEKKLKSALEKAVVNWPQMKEKSVACQAALSLIKPITSDEEDAKLEKLLVKSKKTFDLISDMRKETTSVLDSIKTDMMQPEKAISILKTDPNSPYHLGVKYRNDWANAKLKKQREEAAEATRKENETLEISRLKAEFELIFHNNIVDYVSTMETNIANYFNGLQLEKVDAKDESKVITWEDQIKKFSMKPALKLETFESWFNVPFDNTKLSQEKYDDFVDQVKDLYTYEVINEVYVGQAQPKIDEWKAKLPERKQELETLRDLEASNKKEADKLKKAQEKADKKKLEAIQKSSEENKQIKAVEVKSAQNNEALAAKFETLNVTQTQEDIKAKVKRVAIIDCDPTKIVEVIAQALFHCYMNAEFEGHLKKDKQTNQPLPADENGVPQYNAWVKPILTFLAEKTVAEVPGIKFIEVATTSQRSKKGDE